MNLSTTSRQLAFLKAISVVLLMFLGLGAKAQITTSGCNNTYSYCTLDTVALAPANTTDYTNFRWYGGSVSPANEIVVGNAASFNVDPTRLGNNTIYVTATGGTYILTSEYATPAGCATKNDTLVIDFLTIPDLVTTADTICEAAGDETDLALLVTDDNGVAGSTPAWYPTLSDAENETNQLASTLVGPSATTKYYVRKNTSATDAEGSVCYDIDSVIVDVRCLNLGNLVWYDTDNDGVRDGGEAAIQGVTVELFYDEDGDGVIDPSEQTPYATDVTDASGLYLFENLPEGNFFVGIPASEFGSGGDLQYLHSSGTSINNSGVVSEAVAPNPNTDTDDDDDNGETVKTGFYTGGVMTNTYVALSYQAEPTGETPDNSTIDDEDDNLTLGFSFYGMSIGSTVFADINNSGTLDGTETGIAGVTVILYAGDGTTVLGTTTTDSNGNFLFPNLAEGNYILGVDTSSPALADQHSSDDIATSSNPEAADGDDNGTSLVGGIVKSGTINLDAGTEPTGEPEDGTAMGSPAVSDNPLTPDNNSNLVADFGFVPDCPVLSNPLGEQTICAGDNGDDISVDVDMNTTDIRFVRFNSIQTGSNMYSGGTQIGVDVTPAGASDPYTATYTFNTADFPNASNTTPDTFYVYAILEPVPADPTCRPSQQIRVIVNPLPRAVDAQIAECEDVLGGGEATYTLTDADNDVLDGQSGMTVTYHETQNDADNDVNALSSPYASTATTIYARVENVYGCYATAQVTLVVNAKPDFTLSLPTTCPGDEPTLLLNGLTNGDAMLSFMQLNSEPADSYVANTVFTTADGLVLGAVNSVTVTNEDGCATTKTIAVPDITPLVCPPVNVNVIRNGN